MLSGMTMFAGIRERLQNEMKALTANSMIIKIIARAETKYSLLTDDSILSSTKINMGVIVNFLLFIFQCFCFIFKLFVMVVTALFFLFVWHVFL